VQRVCVSTSSIANDASTVDADAGATQDAEPLDPVWGCLGKVKWGQQDVTAPKVTIRTHFVHFIGEAPIPDMDVKACGRLDPLCTSPFGTGAKTDANGYVNIEVPKFFEGFLSVAPPASFPDMVPSLLNILPPPEVSHDLDASIPDPISPHLASRDELDYLLAQVQSSLDPELGNLLGITLDCQGNPVSGVSLRVSVVSPKTVGYYTDTNGFPSTTTQETAQRGEAGFVNVPAGSLTIDATVNKLSRKMGTFTVVILKGHSTYIAMQPSP
jgi:hypothetical protein